MGGPRPPVSYLAVIAYEAVPVLKVPRAAARSLPEPGRWSLAGTRGAQSLPAAVTDVAPSRREAVLAAARLPLEAVSDAELSRPAASERSAVAAASARPLAAAAAQQLVAAAAA